MLWMLDCPTPWTGMYNPKLTFIILLPYTWQILNECWDKTSSCVLRYCTWTPVMVVRWVFLYCILWLRRSGWDRRFGISVTSQEMLLPWTTLQVERQIYRTSCNNPAPKQPGTVCRPVNTHNAAAQTKTPNRKLLSWHPRVLPRPGHRLPLVNTWSMASCLLRKSKSRLNKHLFIFIDKS